MFVNQSSTARRVPPFGLNKISFVRAPDKSSRMVCRRCPGGQNRRTVAPRRIDPPPTHSALPRPAPPRPASVRPARPAAVRRPAPPARGVRVSDLTNWIAWLWFMWLISGWRAVHLRGHGRSSFLAAERWTVALLYTKTRIWALLEYTMFELFKAIFSQSKYNKKWAPKSLLKKRWLTSGRCAIARG